MSRIIFDDGNEVELSKETTERLRKELVKPKWEFGDIVEFSPEAKRFLLYNENGKLTWFCEENGYELHNSSNIGRFAEVNDYKKVGNLFKE